MEFSDSLHRYFVDQLAGHARADNAAGPGFVLAAADLQLRQLEKLAEHGSPEVGVLTASYAEFTGWLLQDSGDNVGALRHTDQAVELAEVFGDSSLTAYNLMRKSNILTSLHEWQRARSVAQKAVVLAERDAPDLLPVCLRQHALAQSYLRDEREAKEALQRALDLTKPAVRDSTNPSAYCTTSYVQMEAALCLLAVGNPVRSPRRVPGRWRPGQRNWCVTSRCVWPGWLLPGASFGRSRRPVSPRSTLCSVSRLRRLLV